MSATVGRKYKAYPEYKDSGVEWLRGIPKDWSIIPVKYLAELTPKKSAIHTLLMEKECSFLPMEKLKLNSIVLDEIRKVSDVYDGYTYFEDGDVLIAKVTPCFENKNMAVATGLTNGIGFGSSEIYVLRSNERVNNRFLYYRLQEGSFMDIATAAMTGAGGLKRVPAEIVNTYSLATPDFSEQTHITNFLDHETAKIDTLIEEQQSLIRLLKEKRQAVISHAVTKGLNPDAPMKDSCVEWLGDVPVHWSSGRLTYQVDLLVDGTHHSPESYPEGSHLYITAKNIKEHGFDFSNISYISSSDHKEIYSRCSVRKNDVLYIKDGATAGIAMINDLEEEFSLLSSVALIRPRKNTLLPEYLKHHLNASVFKDEMLNRLSGGAMTRFTIDSISRFNILIPSLEEQKKIVEHIEAIESKMNVLIGEAEQAIRFIQERRTALISAAVTGKIDVRHWIAPQQKQPAAEASQ